VPCFFVHKSYRGQGVATALLAHALSAMKKLGAKTIEGYPVNSYSYGKRSRMLSPGPAPKRSLRRRALFPSERRVVVSSECASSRKERNLYLRCSTALPVSSGIVVRARCLSTQARASPVLSRVDQGDTPQFRKCVPDQLSAP
jgi:hypothetical protein